MVGSPLKETTSEMFLKATIEQSIHFILAIDLDMNIRVFNNSCSKVFAKMGLELRLEHNIESFLAHFPDKLGYAKRVLSGETFSVSEYWNTEFYRTDYSPIFNSDKQQIGARILGRAMMAWEHDEMEQVPLSDEEQKAFWPHVVVFGRDASSKSFSRQASWATFTGQCFEEYDGHGWLQAHHPDHRSKVQNIWKAVNSCRTSRAFSFKSLLWCAKLKMYRHILIHATPQFDSKGILVYWYCAGIDIHDLLQTQEELSVTTQRLKIILEAAQIGTWDWNLQTGELRGDRIHAQVFGREFVGSYPVEELLSQIIDRPAVEASLRATIEQGVPYDIEFPIKWQDGSIHWLAGKGELHIAADGRKSLIGVNWEITSKKQLEEEKVRFLMREEEIRSSKQAEEFERKRAEEAEENQRRQEEFIDTVCHEIRNPLVGIYGGVHLATEELNSMLVLQKLDTRIGIGLERIKVHLTSILKCAEQQKILVDDVLDMSKLQNNRIELMPVPFQLSVCFESVMDMYRSRIEEKQLVLKTILPPPDVIIRADTNRLQQVIVNLVSNAVKFTHKGEISVKVEVKENGNGSVRVDVSVTDTGIGISKEDMPLLFDRFSQIRHSHKRQQYGGSGLGLAISKRLVEAMGGRIAVESAVGVGSKFHFDIVAEKLTLEEFMSYCEDSRTNDNSAEAVVPSSHMRILVVDDNSLNQKILASYLEKAGHSVQLASDGFEAVQKAAQQLFDIIFMDIEMPNMNGLEATIALRQREQELGNRSAIIGLSGNARKEKIDAALEAGMDCYLTKPYHRDEILKAIAKYKQSASRSRMRKSASIHDGLFQTKYQKTEK